MARPQGFAVRRRAGRGGDQLAIAVEQVGYAALADRHAAPVELAVDLGHTAVLAVAQIADQRDHIQPELMLRQRQRALGLWSPRLMVSTTGPGLTAPDLQAQANQTAQRHNRPTLGV